MGKLSRLKVSDKITGGPSLLGDQITREKIHRFDHERIHERVAGAHDYFGVFDDSAGRYTFAPALTDASRKTSVFVRFSTVQGSRGNAEPFEMYAILPSRCIRRGEIGISSGMTCRSSFKTLSSSPISYMQ
ncbi:hypothetical protein DFS33DRAFT_209583 [Desarmillaria ectypa]|nr:hypothetical protein DFS33DRAFT_209583 [Desarmillaria ectypa]